MAIKFLNTVAVDTDVLYVDASNDRVGVGTTSPGATFHVSGGAIRIDDSQQLQFGNGNVNLRNDSSGRLYLRAPLAYFFEGNGGYKMVLDGNSGNLGIGTTSPSEKLDVAGDARVQGRIYSNAGGLASIGILGKAIANGWAARYDSNGSNYSGIYFDGNNDSSLYLRDDQGNTNVLLQSDYNSYINGGNFGVGTTSPGQKLHVSSGDQSTARIRLSNTNTASGGDDIELVAGVHNVTQDGFSIYNASGGGTQFVIQGGGNVGIGTTSPQEKLHVQNYTTGESHQAMFKGGAVTVGDYSYISLNNGYGTEYNKEVRLAAVAELGASNKTGFAVLTSPDANGASGHERLRVTADGNVGIGTTSPSTVLEVSSTGVNGVDISQSASNASQSGRLFFTTNTASEGFALFNSNGTFQVNSGGIPNNTSGTNRISIIGSSGNVGIGTTSPSAKLHVLGTTSSVPAIGAAPSTAQFGSSTYGTLFSTLTSGRGVIQQGRSDGAALTFDLLLNPRGGNVGIGVGTSVPAHTLDVYGTGRFTGDMHLGRYIFHNNDTNTWIGFPSNDTITLRTNNSDRVRVTSIGNVGIGTSTPLYLLDAAGTIRCTSLIQTSQSDKKENINDINKSKPRAIPFKEYRYKSNIDSTGRKRYGVLAEDIEDDYPELVYVDSNGEKAVNYIDLLVKRVAELEKELDDISLTPGPKGDKGDTGAVGQRGATGPAGADGKDGSGGDTTVYGCKGEVVGTLGNMVLCEDTVRYQILDPKSGKQIDTLIIPRILK